MKRAIFFDRDGTLLVELGYLAHPSRVAPYHFAAEALRRAREHGYLLIGITNQSAIARGYLSEADLSVIHRRMQDVFKQTHAELDAMYYCPHHPDGTVETYRKKCNCRKPGTELGEQAARRFDIDLKRSFLVGDKETDLLFGSRLGMTACLVRTGLGASEEERLGSEGLKDSMVFDNVLEAVNWITGEAGHLR
ncbi:MAG: HAD family hydrolase [Candidatus Eisenbacteria bacterium]